MQQYPIGVLQPSLLYLEYATHVTNIDLLWKICFRNKVHFHFSEKGLTGKQFMRHNLEKTKYSRNGQHRAADVTVIQ